MTQPPQYRAYLWIALFVLANIALFSSRSVYLDEPFFIALAKTPRSYGFFFQDIQWVFFGTFYPMFGGGSHPPAVTYYLAFLYSLLEGFREVPFRLLYSIFALAAAFGFYGLARRVCVHPLGVTLVFLASPAFLVMSQTLMMDVPMLAFLLLGLNFYFDRPPGMDSRPSRLLLAAICFSFSVMSGYVALVPLACLFVAAILTRQDRAHLASLATAPLALMAWFGVMIAYYGRNPVVPVIRYFQSINSVTENLLALPSFLGGVTLVPWFFVIMRGDRKLRPVIIFSSLAVAAILSFFIDWKSARYGLSYIVFASSGIGLLLAFASEALEALQRRWTTLQLFLILSFPVIVLFFIAIAQFISARYLLLAMPALYLTIFTRSTRRGIALAGIPTLLLSLLVATADYRFVNAYPAWVAAHVDPLQKQGFRVLSAAESGLRFYMEQRGIPTLATSDLRATGGDLIVRHSTLFKYGLSEHVETMLTVVQTFVLSDRFPIRTFSSEAGAGFHGSSLGVLPFALSRAPYDRLEIAEVNPLVAKLPQVAEPGKPIPVWSPEGPILIQRVPELSFPLTLPRDSTIKYELDGPGILEVAGNSIKLRNMRPEPIVWKNFRIVPD